jgi:DNA-binding Lrp family transcriptional regulator
MNILDETDKKILNRIQSDFPITERPYLAVAQELGLEESDVIRRVGRMKEDGIIRRIGGNFGPEKLGYFSTLCAAQVPENRIDEFAEVVNSYPGVTHNYLRKHPQYNIWFTFIEPSREIIERNLEEISRKTGVTKILNLPATNVFKIRAHFNL